MEEIRYANQNKSTQMHCVNGVTYITFRKLSEAGVIHGFSTRLGGVSRGYLGTMNLSFHRGDDPEAVMETGDWRLRSVTMHPMQFFRIRFMKRGSAV